MYAYVCILHIIEMNDNDPRDKRKKLELFCNYKVFTLQ